MTSVEMRGGILPGKAQMMETLSQIFHRKTFSICSSEEATHPVGLKCELFTRIPSLVGLINTCCINSGNEDAYTNGQMHHQRRERRERQRDVSYH